MLPYEEKNRQIIGIFNNLNKLSSYKYLFIFFFIKVEPHIGVAIGESILDLNVISHLFASPLLVNVQNVFKVSIN